MKIVMDSNVIIAAHAGRAGLCHDIFRYGIEFHDVFISNYILDEIRSNLKKKLKLPEALIHRVIDVLDESIEIVNPTKKEDYQCRDAGDLPILNLACAIKADYLISGDNDLLVLKKVDKVQIVSPREFWEKVIKRSKKKPRKK